MNYLITVIRYNAPNSNLTADSLEEAEEMIVKIKSCFPDWRDIYVSQIKYEEHVNEKVKTGWEWPE